MQSEIAPALEPEHDADGHVAPVVAVLAQLNEALAACLDEIESLRERVARLERERRSRAG
jgi:ubiquinone biosynthesis protein UbiJ